MKEDHPYSAPLKAARYLGASVTSTCCWWFQSLLPPSAYTPTLAMPVLGEHASSEYEPGRAFPLCLSVWLLRWSPINSLLFSFLYHVTNSLAYCEKSPKSGHILKHAVEEEPTLPRRNYFLASFSFLSQRRRQSCTLPSHSPEAPAKGSTPFLTMCKSPQHGALRGTSAFHWVLLSLLLFIIFPLKIICGYYRKFRLHEKVGKI